MNALILKYLAPIGAFLLALFAAFVVGKSKQKAKDEKKAVEVKVKKVEAVAVKQVETIKGANDVKNDINKLEPNDAASELRDKWQRD